MTTLFSNRLEESEIIRTVQIIRSRDINLGTNFVNASKLRLTSLSLRINDLLLRNEEIVYETNISRNVPRRKLTLIISTLIFFIWLSLVGIILDSEEIDVDLGGFRPLIEASTFLIAIIAIIALWVKYYSLFNAKLLLTKDRIFFQDVKDPPIWLYLPSLNAKINNTKEVTNIMKPGTFPIVDVISFMKPITARPIKIL